MPSYNKTQSYKAIRLAKNPPPPQTYNVWGAVGMSFSRVSAPTVMVALIERRDVIGALPDKYKEVYQGFMNLYDAAIENCWPEDPDDTEEFIQLCCFIESLEDMAELQIKAENIAEQNATLRNEISMVEMQNIRMSEEVQKLRQRLIQELDKSSKDNDLIERRRQLHEERRRFIATGYDTFLDAPSSGLISDSPNPPATPMPAPFNTIPKSMRDIVDDIVTGQSNLSPAQVADIIRGLNKIQSPPTPPNPQKRPIFQRPVPGQPIKRKKP